MQQHPFRVFIEIWVYFLLFVLLQLLVLGVGRGYLWNVPIDCYFQLIVFFLFTVVIYRSTNRSFKAYRYFMNIMVFFLLLYCLKLLVLDSGHISFRDPQYFVPGIGVCSGCFMEPEPSVLGFGIACWRVICCHFVCIPVSVFCTVLYVPHHHGQDS